MSKKDEIVISKKQVENLFFTSIWILFIVWFVGSFISGLKGAAEVITDDSLDTSFLSAYTDIDLGVNYPIPGGTWGMASLDNTELETTVAASVGEDGVFDIATDRLEEEVLSLLLFNTGSSETYNQFMSFTFKAADEALTESEMEAYASESFIRDMNSSGVYVNAEVTEVYTDEYGGVFVKGIVKETVNTSNMPTEDIENTMSSDMTEYLESESLEEYSSFDESLVTEDAVYEETELYYTQYLKPFGANMVTITFGSVLYDDTVDEYLQLFLNNVRAVQL